MDPDQCLKELRELKKKVGDFIDSYGDDLSTCESADELEQFMANANDLVDHVEAMDEWLKKGGFLPADWVGP